MFPVTIMPVGADVEGQQRIMEKVADQTRERGYHFSARVHTFVYGNVIGK